MKKIISLILACCVVMGMLPLTVFAASTVASGTCGDNLTWTLYDDGELVIDGTGAMTNWVSNNMPWYSCRTQIKTVTIGKSVTSIGNYAFYACKSLTSVDISDSVVTIGDRAFRDCISLTSVYISDSLTTIGSMAFYNCTSLTSVDIGDSVTYIGDYAFYACKSLTSVDILDSVVTIGDRAFYNCTSLTSVDVGDSVTYIGDYAFYACKSLTSVYIGDSVTTIGDYAFRDCISLTSVDIPDSVTYIGDYAFRDCTRLTSVYIGDSVTYIGDYAFYDCSSLTSVDIPDSVTTIGSYAFYSCRRLTSVYIGDGVTTIGYHAFYDCAATMSVNISSIAAWCAINFNDSHSNPLDGIHDNLYLNGILVEDLDIPDSVTSIGDYAFYDYTRLTSVDIPDSVTAIGKCAFYDCSSLTSVDIGDSVTHIGDYAFYDCSSLTSVDIPDSVVTIGDRAFDSCSSLTSVDIGGGVTTIGVYAFSDCTGLTNITVDANNDYYSSDADGVLFNKAKNTLIQYPSGNERTTYTIPENVTSIGIGAFGSCTSLTSVYIGDGVTTIGVDAFYNCGSLTSVDIPDSVTAIGKYAFARCRSLTSVDIPDSVMSIDEYAFENCTNLAKATIYSRTVTFAPRVFNSVSKNFEIHGYSGSTAEAYANANGHKFVPISETETHNVTIEVRDAVTNILIPDSRILVSTNANDGKFHTLENGRITLENVSFPIYRIGANASRYDGLPTMKNVSYPEDGKIVFYLVPSDSRKVPVEGVDIWGYADKLYVGETYQLEADVLPFYASDKNITWSSSDTSIATVDSTGLVTAKNGGTVKITATSTNGKSDSFIFTINNINILSYDNYGYKFPNKSTSFGYSSLYKIPKERYLQAGLTQSVANAKYGKWGGSCFGMSTSSILFYKNVLIEQLYNQDVDFPVQFDNPDAGNHAFLSDKWEVKLRHMIELFQVAYYHPNNTFQHFSVHGVIEEINNGNPVSLLVNGFDRPDPKNGWGHEVVIYGYSVNNDKYTFYIYDCSNFVYQLTYINSSGAYWFEYNESTVCDNRIIGYYTFDTLNTVYNKIRVKNSNNVSSLFSLLLEPSYTYIICPAVDFRIVNSQGQISEIIDGDLTGEIEDISIQYSDYLAEIPTYTLIAPTDTYTITKIGDENIEMTFVDDYMAVDVTAKSSTPVTISSDLHTVTIDNDSESNYSVKYTTYDNIFDEMTVSGTSDNEVTVSLEDANVTVSGAKTVTAVATRSEVPTEISAEIADGQTAVIECTETANGAAELKIKVGDDYLTDATALSTRAKVEMPGYDLESGEYTSGQTLTLSKDDDTIIYYTVDGSYPSADNGMLYTMPIIVNQSMTVMAISTKYGYENSDILTLEYTLPEVDVPFVTLPEGEYVGLQQVDILADEDASIYYTIDGSDPLNGGTLYTHPIILREDTTLKVYAYINGCISAVSEYNYVVSNADELAFDDIIIADEMVKLNITSNVNRNGVLKVTCYNPIGEVIEEKYCDITLMANVVNSQYVEIDTRCATKISASLLDSEDNSILLCDDFSKDFPLRTVDSGKCGDLEWALYYTGEMTITGTGAMCDYSYDSVPWYYNRNSINKVTIGDGVTTIGRNAFSSCENLTSVTISEGVTTIGSSAFENCIALTNITIPDSVISIGSDAFSGTGYSIDSNNWENDVLYLGNCLIEAKTTIKDCVIKDGTRILGNGAFYYCYSLTSVIFPESMKIIPSGAFGECDKFRSATFYSRDVEFGSGVFTDICGDPIENLEIYGYTGSTVEAYASANDHTFVALPEITTVVEKTSMILGNDLSIMFAFTADDIVGESNYAVITKTYADGTASRTEQIEQTAWGEPIVINGKNYYAISFSGVAAKEMTDKVQVQIFNEDGKAISEVFTDSIRDYAMRMIENGTNVQMFVDMLVYGAEAQKQFDNYAGNDLATSQLTTKQLAQATPTVNCKNNLVANDKYRASSLILENNIKLLFLFAGIDPTMTATITYEDHYGNTQNIIVEGTSFAPVTYQGENCYSITVDKLVVADARQLVSVVVNDADENEIASASDSVESYIARMSTTGTLYESILKFADSAATILHNYN